MLAYLIALGYYAFIVQAGLTRYNIENGQTFLTVKLLLFQHYDIP